MKDETVTLSRIVADCVQSQFRYLDNKVDPHAFGDRVAREVIGRLRSARIDVVSRCQGAPGGGNGATPAAAAPNRHPRRL